MKYPKIAIKLLSRRFILVIVVLAGTLAGGSSFYVYRQKQLDPQNIRTTVAPKEEAQITTEEPVQVIDSSAPTLEQTEKVATPQPAAAPTSQPPNPLPTYSKKDIKLIQGGALVPDKSNVIFYKNQTRPSVTFTTSDGALVRFPSTQWYDRRPYGFVVSTIPDEKRSTWTVQIDASNMPVGTFNAEAVSIINDAEGNSVQYIGTVTVNVVDSPY